MLTHVPPAAIRDWEHGPPRGLGWLGASGLQNREVCDDQELAGGRSAEAVAARGHGLRGRVREQLPATLSEGTVTSPAVISVESLTLQGLGWWQWRWAGWDRVEDRQKEGSLSV